MRFVRSSLAVLALAGASLAGGCGSTSGEEGVPGEGGGEMASMPDAQAVTGDHQVLIRTWDPRDLSRPPFTAALVNESSDAGRRLTSGKASSTVVRVVTDQEMGALLQVLDEKGFSANATDGVTLQGLKPDGRRRGVIIVEKDGATRGIEFFPNMAGTAIPTVYTECKQIIVSCHRRIEGIEVRATTGAEAEDPSRTFQAPPIRMPNR